MAYAPHRFRTIPTRRPHRRRLVGGLQAIERDPSARVIVLEAKTIGWAASGRNGGFCEASLTHGEANGLARFPREHAQLDRLGTENLDQIAATVARLELDCDFERTGSLAVATEKYQLSELGAAHDGDGELYYDAAGMRSLVNSPTYQGGLWSKHATALVHPAKLAAELARACVEATAFFTDADRIAKVSRGLGEAMVGIAVDSLGAGDLLAQRGW